MTLSLNDMAAKVQLSDAKRAEKHILDMVCIVRQHRNLQTNSQITA